MGKFVSVSGTTTTTLQSTNASFSRIPATNLARPTHALLEINFPVSTALTSTTSLLIVQDPTLAFHLVRMALSLISLHSAVLQDVSLLEIRM